MKQLDVMKLSKRYNLSQSKQVQVCTEILNSRVMRATLAFKQFLTDHQQVIKKQEAKKERLKSGIATSSALRKPVPSKSGVSNGAFKGKMKILPSHHYSQLSTNESLDNESGGSVALEMQETYTSTRTNSIETIEKTLYDITSLFKRFASIVQEH